MSGPLLKYTDRFCDLIDDLDGPVAEKLLRIEGDYILDNYLRITLVDISQTDWNFDVTINDKVQRMKISKFIKYIVPEVFSNKEIFDFAQAYNSLKRGKPVVSSKYNFKKVEIPEFSYNPEDIRSTFISLTTKTYPHGHEEEVLQFLPKLEKDKCGNYYKIIGKSETMFTSHLDTADRKQVNVSLYSMDRNGDEFLTSDGSSILGSDDKSGVTIMLHMMHHNIPGLYYFFIGEERGGIGSHDVAQSYDDFPYLKGIKRCVSFDRRNYYSVITNQMGRQCCSDQFATALAQELNKSGLNISLDPTGIYTDSASFIDEIPECTNISVGYFNEHTVQEIQNISFLERLAKACLKVNWEGLPTVKKVGFDEEILRKYQGFISAFKKSAFNLQMKMVSEYGSAYIKIDLDDPDIDIVHKDLLDISLLMSKFKMDPDIFFDEQYIKIELR